MRFSYCTASADSIILVQPCQAVWYRWRHRFALNSKGRNSRHCSQLALSPTYVRVRDALALVLFTGCRSGEVVAALWRDIDLGHAVRTIREFLHHQWANSMWGKKRSDLRNTRRLRKPRMTCGPIQLRWRGRFMICAVRPDGSHGTGEAPLPARRSGPHP